jgi:hypothetical protein
MSKFSRVFVNDTEFILPVVQSLYIMLLYPLKIQCFSKIIKNIREAWFGGRDTSDHFRSFQIISDHRGPGVPRKKKATKKYSQMVYAANLAPFLQKAGS